MRKMSKETHPSVIIFNAQLEIEKDEIMDISKQTGITPIAASLVAFGKMMWNLGRVFKKQDYNLKDYSITKLHYIIKNDLAPITSEEEISIMSILIGKSSEVFFKSKDLNSGIIRYAHCLLMGGWLYQQNKG
jgi:hypothetical protein